MRPLAHWIPALFSAALSIIVLTLSTVSAAPSMPGAPAFFTFLPMAFVFSAFVTEQMRREIRELRAQVDELRKREPPRDNGAPTEAN
jgi:hypothetical protein